MIPRAACDTSVLVPALLSWHPAHDPARTLLVERVAALPAHVVVECFSVLTRLPAPHRVAAQDAAEVIGELDRPVVGLDPAAHLGLIRELAGHGIRGGAVYDALVAATARSHGLTLLTRDRRARMTYEALGVPWTSA